MKNIPIKNKELIKLLDEVKKYYDDREEIIKVLEVNGNPSDADYFTGDEYRDIIIKKDERHEGFPDAGHSIALKASHINSSSEYENKPMKVAKLIERYSKLNEKLCSLFSTRNCALFQMYPPGGFISWHNNANASAYNLIFSWSETGDGHFKYVDGKTGEDVVMQDVQGWQCKAGYFGSYYEPWDKRVYHCARTNCWRITVSYIFDRSDMSMSLHEDIIEEIMSDY
jgi:hypothetical protein